MVLDIKEGLVECATVCVKSVVILRFTCNKFVTFMFKHCGPHRIFQVEVKARLAMIMRDSYRSVYA